MSEDRLPPQNREAEKAVLGSCLRWNAAIADVVSVLRADDFYMAAHQSIWESIVSLWDRHAPVDLVTLAEELNTRKKIEDVGGHAYLGELWDASPTGANAVYYAGIVREKSVVRQLIHIGAEMQRDGYEQTDPAERLVEVAEQKVFAIGQGLHSNHTFTLEEVISQTYDRIDYRKGGHLIDGVSTGWLDLDELTSGFHDSELCVVAARPSIGKTAFGLAITRHVGVNLKLPALFISLEQSRLEIGERLLSMQSSVDSHAMRCAKVNSDDMDRLMAAGGVLRKTKILIEDAPGATMLRLASTCRRLKSKNDIRLVAIDYLQLIDLGEKKKNRQEEVSDVSRRLKHLARELRIPIVCMAQLNRSVEERVGGRPRLSDLRESGSIEQDSDCVILLSRTNGDGQPVAEITVDVAKQRNGRTGEVKLAFRKSCMRFESMQKVFP